MKFDQVLTFFSGAPVLLNFSARFLSTSWSSLIAGRLASAAFFRNFFLRSSILAWSSFGSVVLFPLPLPNFSLRFSFSSSSSFLSTKFPPNFSARFFSSSVDTGLLPPNFFRRSSTNFAASSRVSCYSVAVNLNFLSCIFSASESSRLVYALVSFGFSYLTASVDCGFV